MPHWRQEAKENARQVRHTKELLAAAEDILAAIDNGLRPKATDMGTLRLRLIVEKIKANSTEPVE